MSVSCGLLVWYCCKVGSICGSKPRNGGYIRRRPKSATQGLANMRCAAVMMFSFRAQVACAAPPRCTITYWSHCSKSTSLQIHVRGRLLDLIIDEK